MTRRSSAALMFALLAAACGPGQKQRTVAPIPTGDPKPVDKPKPTPIKDPTKLGDPDPWAGKPDLIQAPAPAKATAVLLPPAQRFTLANGLTVIAVPRPELPVIGFDIAVRAGNLDESREKRVLADMVAELLSKGTKSKSALQIAQAIDFVGGHMGAAAGYENINVACSVLSRESQVCVSLLADMLMNPKFAPQEIELVREKFLAGLARILDDPDALAGLHFANQVFGDEHPRGWPTTELTVAQITQKDLIAFHKLRFTPKNTVLAVAGDFDPAKLKTQIEKAFGKWKGGAVPGREIADPPMQPSVRIRLVDNPTLTQSTIVLGHPGIRHTDPDYYAVRVMNHILGGGGFSSRLMKVLRAESGKSYSASSGFESFETRGIFEATVATRTEETGTTLKMLLGEIKKMRDGGVTADELEHAQSAITGGYGVAFQTASDVATALLAAELHKLDGKYVEELPLRIAGVTREEVNAAAKKRLMPDNVAVVIVGNGEEIAPQLRKAGLIFERIAYTDPVSTRDRAELAKLFTDPVPPEEHEKAKKILDAALATKGGADKLKAIQSISMQGKAVLMGSRVPGGRLDAKVERVLAPPDKIRLEMTIGSGKQQLKLLQLLNVDKGLLVQGPQKEKMPAPMVQDLKDSIWRDQDFVLLRHLDAGVRIRVLGQVAEKGHAVDVILLISADRKIITTLFIDAKEHLLIRQRFREAAGDNVEEYGDYRDVGGIKFAHLIGQRQSTQAMMVQIDKIEVNAPLDPKLFELK